MFVIDCIAPFLKKLNISEEELKTMFVSLCPTTRKVSALLKFPEVMSPEEIVVSSHLRRFVRELDIATLKKFMQFCTGSDLLLQDHIDVSFVNVTGIARRPVAHTCSCLLEIPKTYESFPGFRTKFGCPECKCLEFGHSLKPRKQEYSVWITTDLCLKAQESF